MRGRLLPSSHLNTLRGSIKTSSKSSPLISLSSIISQLSRHSRLRSTRSDRLTDEQYRSAMEILPDIFKYSEEDLSWLVERTEKWCQDRAVFNAVMESITIIDGNHKSLSRNAIPDVLSKALSVTFDTNIGHDYLESVDARYEFYTTTEERIPFDLEYFNRITKGGLPNKTLNIALAGTGVGKSLFMCHCAGAALSQGKNVLYITMEMDPKNVLQNGSMRIYSTSR